jgi:heptosyltransferase I
MSHPARPDPAPKSICIIRLSAIGDTCHAVPLIRALQREWPGVRITWIIGRVEAKLMALMPEIEFIRIDKRRFWREWLRVRGQLAARRFDVLLHLHVSLRASLVSLLVHAPVKIGFDRARSRDFQWLFTNRHIQPRRREHVLDSFWGFAEALGINERRLEWNMPLPPDALAYARGVIPDARPTLLISPCSSHVLRNWRPEFYARVADHAVRRWHMRVVLCGGPTALERTISDQIIAAAQSPLIDQVGRDTLPQMLALLQAATVLLSPDSGPAHMAAVVGTPVIGLYAPTNPARSGPYCSQAWCVDRFPEAARVFMGAEPDALPWWVKIEKPGVMDLIQPADVIERLDEFMQRRSASGMPEASELKPPAAAGKT